MKISPITAESIDYVIENLSEVSKIEADVFELTMGDLRQMYIGFIDQPFSGTFLSDEGIPFAVMCLHLIGAMKWRAHFIFTEEAFRDNAVALTLFFKRFSSRIIMDSKGEIEILSIHGLEEVDRWHTALGFKFSGMDADIARFVKKGS